MDFLKAASEIFNEAIETLDSIAGEARFSDGEQYAGIVDATQVVLAYTHVQEQRTANLIAFYAAVDALHPGYLHTGKSNELLDTLADEIKARLGITETVDA